jgi:predicted alpha/beta-fold hydrolase
MASQEATAGVRAAAFAPPRAFVPARLLGNGHLQTLWPFFLRRLPALPIDTELWRLPDGECLAVHLLDRGRERPGVLVIHGLEGSSESPYVRGLLGRIRDAGWNAAAVDLRSCGRLARGALRSRTAYHAGQTEDLPFIVERLSARWQGPLAAVGFSLGGNMLLKWLGETGDGSPLKAAVGVSVPFDLAASAAVVDGPGIWSAGYRSFFMRSLRRKGLAMARDLGSKLDPAAIRRSRTFRQFDGAVTAPLFGFASAEDYWARSSSAQFLPAIRRPTLLVSAEDDPIVPASSIPRETIARNPALHLWLAPVGGHVGFVGGSPWRPEYVAESLIVDFLGPRL